jgi:hypothetical protein
MYVCMYYVYKKNADEIKESPSMPIDLTFNYLHCHRWMHK